MGPCAAWLTLHVLRATAAVYQRYFQPRVIDVHDIHVWDLKPGKTMVIAHVLAKTNTEREVLI